MSENNKDGAVPGPNKLAAMLDDARQGRFCTLIIENCDRLSRNLIAMEGIFLHLEACGVVIHQVGRGRLRAEDVFVRGLMTKAAREAMRQRIRIGQELAARRGLVPSACCFGYATVPGKPGQRAIVTEQAQIVREVFDMCAGGASNVRIAAVLNARPDGVARTWTPASIGRLLRNPLYAGTLVHGRRTLLRDRTTGRARSMERSREEWSVTPVEHLRIVSQEAWDAVQALLRCRSMARRSKA